MKKPPASVDTGKTRGALSTHKLRVAVMPLFLGSGCPIPCQVTWPTRLGEGVGVKVGMAEGDGVGVEVKVTVDVRVDVEVGVFEGLAVLVGTAQGLLYCSISAWPEPSKPTVHAKSCDIAATPCRYVPLLAGYGNQLLPS